MVLAEKLTDIVVKNLRTQRFDAIAIHGGFSQNKRTNTMDMFNKGKVGVLVCTDVAARGLHIENVSHVYNYDVPKSSEDYIHRIGRTARAGMQGDAVTLLTERDHENFRRVLSDRSIQIQKVVPPHFEMVKFQRFHEKRERGDGNFRVSRDHSKNTGFRGDSRDKSFGEEKKHFGNRSGSSRRRWNN